MKNLPLLSLFTSALFLFLLVFTPFTILAGPQCIASNGICRTSCPPNEQNLGQKDCSPAKICCVPPPSGSSAFTGWCDENVSINTALGCLDITGKNTVSQILSWAVVVGGGIAFLLIIYAGLQMATASGDPKRVKASQELLTAALGGLILIVLSIVLLNFIGVKILNLKNLGFGP